MAPKDGLNILVGDDHQIVFNGITELLHQEPWLQHLGYAATITEISEQLKEQPFELLLLDLNIQGTNSLDHINHYKAIAPCLKIIIFSSYDNKKLIDKARELGANGYLNKNSDAEQIKSVIHRVVNGEDYFEGENAAADEAGSNFIQFTKLESLSKREKQIANLILSGLNEMEIANQLFVSKNTVRTHKKSIFRKLSVSGVGGLLKHLQSTGEEC